MRDPARATAALFVMLICGSACQLNLSAIPVERIAPGADAGTGRPGGGTSSAGTMPDAMATGGGLPSGDAGDAAPSLAGLKHPGCAAPIAADYPAAPTATTSPLGRPDFDRWLDFTCDDVATHPTCGEYDGHIAHPCPLCVGSPDASRGVCAQASPAIESEPCLPVHDLAHDCWLCVVPEAKRRACCLGLNVDCRPALDAVRGAVGQACVHHDHCEDGLLCVAAADVRGSVCACPGVTPQLTTCSQARPTEAL